ncbi:hypothetical protein KP509_27G059900 [Ceratopteris richardii]|uniref:Uncharacterized protein n=1 Tax=Ceratopteris richardii TaxID=49495 RepID=A0A8T2RJE6_CERRI|nr:hypothetical protein KP509_27G059900 [Ceratopteris richardii]
MGMAANQTADILPMGMAMGSSSCQETNDVDDIPPHHSELIVRPCLSKASMRRLCKSDLVEYAMLKDLYSKEDKVRDLCDNDEDDGMVDFIEDWYQYDSESTNILKN